MGIAIRGFSGQRSKVDPALLPANMAETASNCELLTGTLKPLKAPSVISANPFPSNTVKALHITYAGRGISFFEDVHIAKENTVGYGKEWIYVTGFAGHGPMYCSLADYVLAFGSTPVISITPSEFKTLGLPAPTNVITGVATGTGTGPAIAQRYVWTWISIYGEESAPSPPSDIINYQSGQMVDLSLTPEAPPRNCGSFRVYRTDINGNYRFLAQVGWGTWSGSVIPGDIILGEALKTTGWVPPPASLTGIKNGPNGVIGGFFDKTVAFCQPYAPYAWPVEYQFNVDFPVVAVCPNAGGWIVLTTGSPYFIYGSDPSSMSMTKINQNQACVAARSVVDMGDYVVYAGPDGLVSARGMEFSLLTKAICTRDQWQAITPSTLIGCHWQGLYIGFMANGVGGSFIYYPEENYFVVTDISATAAVVFPLTDSLYIYDSSRKNYEQFGAGSNKTFTWKSKRFAFSSYLNLGAAKIDAVQYPVTVNIYKDNEISPFYSVSVASSDTFKLPAGYMANSFNIEITGTNEVKAVYLGQDIEDINNHQ